MTAPVIRQSWFRLFGFRTLMILLLLAWKEQGHENAGNLFTFFLWFAAAVAFIAAFTSATEQSAVRTNAQTSWLNAYRICFVILLAWYGHPGLALVYLVGVLAAEVHERKFDDNGMPLPTPGGAV